MKLSITVDNNQKYTKAQIKEIEELLGKVINGEITNQHTIKLMTQGILDRAVILEELGLKNSKEKFKEELMEVLDKGIGEKPTPPKKEKKKGFFKKGKK